MKVQLFDRQSQPVVLVEVSDTPPMPTVVTWNDRVFALSAGRYVEATVSEGWPVVADRKT